MPDRVVSRPYWTSSEKNASAKRREPDSSLQFHVPVRVIQERLPGLVLLLRQLQVQHRAPLRLLRLADQVHMRLPRRPAALADIAAHAGADDVLPGAASALAPRDHVIQAQ